MLLVLVVAALVPPAPARACSEVLLGGHNDSAFELPVSARNYDYRLASAQVAPLGVRATAGMVACSSDPASGHSAGGERDSSPS